MRMIKQRSTIIEWVSITGSLSRKLVGHIHQMYRLVLYRLSTEQSMNKDTSILLLIVVPKKIFSSAESSFLFSPVHYCSDVTEGSGSY